ncbi:MAG: hypothetical protein AAF750_15125 [Planctomycetota bacterium]
MLDALVSCIALSDGSFLRESLEATVGAAAGTAFTVAVAVLIYRMQRKDGLSDTTQESLENMSRSWIDKDLGAVLAKAAHETVGEIERANVLLFLDGLNLIAKKVIKHKIDRKLSRSSLFCRIFYLIDQLMGDILSGGKNSDIYDYYDDNCDMIRRAARKFEVAHSPSSINLVKRSLLPSARLEE